MQISEATSDNLLLLDRCETIQVANGSVPQLFQLNGEFVASDFKKKMGYSWPLYLYFRLFCILIPQLVDKILPMTGFEPRISGVRSNRSTN